MNTRHDNPDGPEDIDAAFAEIVAGLRQDMPMSSWPEDATADDGSAGEPTDDHDDATGGIAARRIEEPAPRDWTPPVEDEGHFEPPEPPPLPKPRPATIVGFVAIVTGIALLLATGLTGVGDAIALPLGLVLISAGIAWLLFRIRRGPPDSDDDGARL